jgi:hypothetical protein
MPGRLWMRCISGQRLAAGGVEPSAGKVFERYIAVKGTPPLFSLVVGKTS